MISDLKRKTAGRDMYKVLSELEGREITPPRRNYSMSPPPPMDSRNGRKPEPKRIGRYDFDDDDDDGGSGGFRSSAAPRFGSKSGNERRPEPRGGSYRFYKQ